MKLFNKVRNVIRAWLDITPAQGNIYCLNETFSFESNAIKNRIWMRGDPEEPDKSYEQLPKGNSYFWTVSPHIKICKIHSDFPVLMVQVLTDVVIRNLNGIDVASRQLDLGEISKDDKFDEVLHKAVKDTLSVGDGTFKVSFNTKLSEYPIVESVPGDKVEIVYERGRFVERVFKTEYRYIHERYVLYEYCGKGYIKSVLIEWGIDDLLSLSTIPQTAKLIDVAFTGYKLPGENGENEVMGHFTMTIPFKAKDSARWENRGESTFDKRTSSSDGLDEIINQWADTVRAARTK